MSGGKVSYIRSEVIAAFNFTENIPIIEYDNKSREPTIK